MLHCVKACWPCSWTALPASLALIPELMWPHYRLELALLQSTCNFRWPVWPGVCGTPEHMLTTWLLMPVVPLKLVYKCASLTTKRDILYLTSHVAYLSPKPLFPLKGVNLFTSWHTLSWMRSQLDYQYLLKTPNIKISRSRRDVRGSTDPRAKLHGNSSLRVDTRNAEPEAHLLLLVLWAVLHQTGVLNHSLFCKVLQKGKSLRWPLDLKTYLIKQSKWTQRPDATTVTISECHHAYFIISFVPLSTNIYKDIYEDNISFTVKNSSIKHIANYIMHLK